MTLDLAVIDDEITKCSASTPYFVHNYCRIKDEQKGTYQQFRLWPAQVEALNAMVRERLLLLLKARQIGMTTLVRAFAVHQAIFRPGSNILLFSKGQMEARELLRSIRTMVLGLPEWLQPVEFRTDASQKLEFSNGSAFLAFASKSSGGDSFTASLVVVDEADLIQDLDLLLSGAKPTIDGGGKLILLSRTEKEDPQSPFKRLCRAAMAGEISYKFIFFPWWVRPGRTRPWYEEQKNEIEKRTGSVDELYANYPETPEQALAARILDKRFPLAWLEQCYHPQNPLRLPSAFAGWANLTIYKLPEPGREYVAGVDVALGNPNSDDSVCVMLDKLTLEEVATLAGKIEPTVHAHRCHQLATYYNSAPLLIERNGSHGHKCIEAARAIRAVLLKGRDGKFGWWTDDLGKGLMYDAVAEVARNGAMVIHSKALLDQLASLDVAQLDAPFGFHDDIAVGFGLAVQAATRKANKPDLVVVTTGGAKPEQSPKGKYRGVEWIETYGTYYASIEANGAKVRLGEWGDQEHAGAAVNCALVALGQEPPNEVRQLDEAAQREIEGKVLKVLKERKVL